MKRGDRQKVLRLAKDEFFRRFMLNVLPDDFHRIRHYGLLAGAGRKINIAQIRNLIGAAPPVVPPKLRWSSSRLPCAKHAHAATARCGSSKSSDIMRPTTVDWTLAPPQHPASPVSIP
ncbi:hypothetical protein EEB11_19055 [Pseudotabrizicola sediminis]|uniref:Transposase IS801/IS1294 domain-containing protein n=1 Tax=Pseudotabrizicola sediminis TaxID=2486418 RepID=A0ABY2KGK1_9RHOB|nr:hypothetical protein EEB11_19055 [Pseudotabrizicola sediminis]